MPSWRRTRGPWPSKASRTPDRADLGHALADLVGRESGDGCRLVRCVFGAAGGLVAEDQGHDASGRALVDAGEFADLDVDARLLAAEPEPALLPDPRAAGPGGPVPRPPAHLRDAAAQSRHPAAYRPRHRGAQRAGCDDGHLRATPAGRRSGPPRTGWGACRPPSDVAVGLAVGDTKRPGGEGPSGAFWLVAPPAGLEPAAKRLEGACSIH